MYSTFYGWKYVAEKAPPVASSSLVSVLMRAVACVCGVKYFESLLPAAHCDQGTTQLAKSTFVPAAVAFEIASLTATV